MQRRKALTREALIGAARTMLVDGRSSTASIQEITETADVGFGSFYNHFTDKQELFRIALEEVLEEWGQFLDELSTGIEDPAEVFITCVRRTGRLGLTHPDVATIIAAAGFDAFDSPTGLAPRSTRDLARCLEAGRFRIDSPVVAFAVTTGSMLGLLHLWMKDRGLVDEQAVDDVAEQILRMFGLPEDEARVLAHKPLPRDPRR